MKIPTYRRDVIIVIGSVTTAPEHAEEALAHSLRHVQRSRLEPGCISHDVHRHAEDPLRLVFVERWQDRAAVDAHFAVPDSGEFVKAVGVLASQPPEMAIYTVS